MPRLYWRQVPLLYPSRPACDTRRRIITPTESLRRSKHGQRSSSSSQRSFILKTEMKAGVPLLVLLALAGWHSAFSASLDVSLWQEVSDVTVEEVHLPQETEMMRDDGADHVNTTREDEPADKDKEDRRQTDKEAEAAAELQVETLDTSWNSTGTSDGPVEFTSDNSDESTEHVGDFTPTPASSIQHARTSTDSSSKDDHTEVAEWYRR
ncbi:uncharacterized protein LOC134332711 [Trichomycterus rosablanca]|uniref:uncharacterized protein LOC134332711 n=1 Tax=Trichomycterus rosablanca TaxID=2290929 RepID=UPI002F352B3C